MASGKILTVEELARYLNVHRITIYRLLKSGRLPGFKIGRVWRFDSDQVDQWIRENGEHAALLQQEESEGVASVPTHNSRKRRSR